VRKTNGSTAHATTSAIRILTLSQFFMALSCGISVAPLFHEHSALRLWHTENLGFKALARSRSGSNRARSLLCPRDV
jgi:hypothetical protein